MTPRAVSVTSRRSVARTASGTGRIPPPSAPHARPRSGESARSLLNTVLGEFVYAAGGAAWTSTFVEALALLDVEEKAARQALARSAGKVGSNESARGGGCVGASRHGACSVAPTGTFASARLGVPEPIGTASGSW